MVQSIAGPRKGRQLTTSIVFIAAALGAVAPAIWLVEFCYRGGPPLGHPDSILDQLVLFFPFWVLFLGAPYPLELVSISIIALSIILNMLLYAVGAFIIVYVALFIRGIVSSGR
jgi:hypothetical protein